MSGSTARPGRGTIVLLAAIAALGSLATQLLLPALPALAHELQVAPGDAQLIIGIYLVGLGGGQLVAGPMADRRGRRPVLLMGLVVYCIGSLAGALATNLPLLLAARLVQSLGASAGLVTARVLVSDLFPPEEAARRQATLMSIILISPAIAPAIGGTISDAAGWRAVFLVLMLAGAGGLLLCLTRLPASIRSSRPPVGSLAQGLARLARNPRFLAPACTVAAGSAALYMFLGAAPFLLAHDHGLRPRDLGFAMMLIALASIAGTFAVARFDRKERALLVGATLLLAGALSLGITALAGWHSLPAFMLPMIVLGLGAGISGPAGVTRVIRSQPGLEGTSTSISGAFQMLASAFCAALSSRISPVSTGSLAVVLTLATAVALIAAISDRKVNARACIADRG